MTEYTIDQINELISSHIGNREVLDVILESIRSGKSLTLSQVNYLDVLEKSRYHLTELAKSIQAAKKCMPKKESLPPSTDILSASELIKQNKFEITTLTSLSKLDPTKQAEPELLSDVINSLQKQLGQKHTVLKKIQSDHLLTDLKEKNQQLEDNVLSKKEHIEDLKSKQQTLQKEIADVGKEIEKETTLQADEMSSMNEQLSQLATEENEFVEKIYHEQKLRATQEKELAELRQDRLKIVNKNKDTQKIQEKIQQHRNRLEKITYDRSMLELEIKSQMNLLDEEHKKERDIISKIVKQYRN